MSVTDGNEVSTLSDCLEPGLLRSDHTSIVMPMISYGLPVVAQFAKVLDKVEL